MLYVGLYNSHLLGLFHVYWYLCSHGIDDNVLQSLSRNSFLRNVRKRAGKQCAWKWRACEVVVLYLEISYIYTSTCTCVQNTKLTTTNRVVKGSQTKTVAGVPSFYSSVNRSTMRDQWPRATLLINAFNSSHQSWLEPPRTRLHINLQLLHFDSCLPVPCRHSIVRPHLLPSSGNTLKIPRTCIVTCLTEWHIGCCSTKTSSKLRQ